ncbi:tetratricopeptide repeat protein [Methanobacterium spitsbergense]|uniref:Tetratricopeptide repeat protein n=1 Tax=Methanobacterium spitsbergense TaxID=2874285 RepID=A0A8T5V497_9EURY|nr:tetratricopeptide repeat protein [Methanobacterium spitsbergense]MBZ2166495.1 tetratricopeptide repeat protein [Methanobacterium spitsbergense]
MSEQDVEMFYKQAMSYLGQGEIDKAIEFFDKALKLDDWYLPAWNDKGVALLEKKDYVQALNCFEKVVLLDPVSSMPLYNKGYVQLILENYSDSIETFDSFLEMYQNKDDFYKYALFLNGQAHYNLKEYKQAHESLEEAILHDKTFKEARELIIKVLNEEKKIK